MPMPLRLTSSLCRLWWLWYWEWGSCRSPNGSRGASRRGEILLTGSRGGSMKKKSLLILAFALFCLSSASLQAQTTRKVVFGVPVTPPNVVHIPPYVAKELGFFAENNIDVEFVTFEGGTQTLRGSVAGGLDITGTSSDPAIIAAAKGAGIKVVGT